MTQIIQTQTFEERMKARIKDSIGDLITDEDLTKMVDRSVEEVFFKPRSIKQGYNTKEIDPFLNEIIKELLLPQVRDAVGVYIKANPEVVKKALEKVMSDGVGLAVVNSISNQFSTQLYNFQSSIEQQLQTR